MSVSKICYDPKHPAGFGSVTKLVKASKNKKRDLEKWLPSQNTYTMHKHACKSFPVNPFTVTNIDDVWEMDPAYLSSLAKYNDKYKYLLNVLDAFSRYDWSAPVMAKTGTSIISALDSLFKNRNQSPYNQKRALNLLMQLCKSI